MKGQLTLAFFPGRQRIIPLGAETGARGAFGSGLAFVVAYRLSVSIYSLEARR